MLVQYWTVDVPYKSVIADLASRDGKAGPDNYPFDGMRSYLEQKCRNPNIAAWMDALCNSTEDFDIRNEKFCEAYHNSLPYRCIDEVPVTALQSFMEQKLYGATHYTSSSAVQYHYSTLEQYTLPVGEDEHSEFENAFKSESMAYSPEELTVWKRKLPYLVKRLVDRSEVYGVNVMSGIVARIRCAKRRENVTLSNLLKQGILSYPFNIPLDRSMVPEAFVQWITGVQQDEYYDDMCELCNICARLNINLANENPTLYTKEFVSKLASDYIVENVRLYRSVARALSPSELSPDLLRIISKMSLDDVVKLPSMIHEQQVRQTRVTPVDAIRHTIDLFRYHSGVYSEFIKQNYCLSKNQLILLFYKYYQITRHVYDIRLVSFVDEFLMSRGTEYFLLDVSSFCSDPFSGTVAVIHSSGALLLVRLDSLLSTFKYTSFNEFYTGLQNYHDALTHNMQPKPLKWYAGI